MLTGKVRVQRAGSPCIGSRGQTRLGGQTRVPGAPPLDSSLALIATMTMLADPQIRRAGIEDADRHRDQRHHARLALPEFFGESLQEWPAPVEKYNAGETEQNIEIAAKSQWFTHTGLALFQHSAYTAICGSPFKWDIAILRLSALFNPTCAGG
jgi:hypothetical protein